MSNDNKENLIDKDQEKGELELELKGNIVLNEEKEEIKKKIKISPKIYRMMTKQH